MRRFPILSILFLSAACGLPPCTAQTTSPKIATVDMQVLFKRHPLTHEAEKELSGERARVQKDNNERGARVREVETELNALRKQLEDPTVNEAKKQALFKQWQMRQQEGLAMERERVEFQRRRTQAINERMVQRMKEILAEIRKLVVEQAKKDGYDHVLDSSGLSTSQVPILLYSKDATDITAGLLGQLDALPEPAEDTPSPDPQ
ncbi:OmpH family outer membrane protein [Luteolibacter sp. SL250]|uniref:OmpH family outer membrane protein n=1 Tax=Luteolibacter sp. SL250 TaxID=2995170 RepID=UPI00226FDF33|nr:OmpH family outer membrane protein [Luteolibacter sp. SL250]WAC19992.1 OmpH family outer membrane protein [Luteolibacter sp. SL250]